ncbi:MAG: FtsW/RodA/SpoVE family cell cycle protein [Kiloniellales bacterium]
MIGLPRSDTSIVGCWWWTVDRWTLLALTLLIGLGVVLMMAASPAAGGRIGLDGFQLAQRQLMLVPVALVLMLAVSLLDPRWVRRLAVVGLAGSILLLAATLAIGVEIKGATRWIQLGGLSIQPSEFAKPCLTVTAAWLFASGKLDPRFPGGLLASLLFAAVAGLVIAQPDLGQSFVIGAVWGLQLFLAGLSMPLVIGLAAAGIGVLVSSYFLLPHVASRVDRFLDPAAGDHYQVERSIEAFMNGGLWGRGPGEGTVKSLLPDSHSDFIFAVAGEELGLVACLFIVALFAFVVLRGFARLLSDDSLFALLAGTGLIAQFGLQAIINMATALRLMPTKGMTLPFISYGGSSLMALALGMGMLLALTRKRVGRGEVT